MAKMTLTCESFKPLRRNTLYGFAEILIGELRLTVKDVAIHEKNGRSWAQLPSKPLISKDGVALKDETTGKVRYVPIMQFTGREVADAFSEAVIKAVLEVSPDAFDDFGQPKQSASQRSSEEAPF
jgi:hypothetical protein